MPTTRRAGTRRLHGPTPGRPAAPGARAPWPAPEAPPAPEPSRAPVRPPPGLEGYAGAAQAQAQERTQEQEEGAERERDLMSQWSRSSAEVTALLLRLIAVLEWPVPVDGVHPQAPDASTPATSASLSVLGPAMQPQSVDDPRVFAPRRSNTSDPSSLDSGYDAAEAVPETKLWAAPSAPGEWSADPLLHEWPSGHSSDYVSPMRESYGRTFQPGAMAHEVCAAPRPRV